ncbi:hypothetical protein GCM10007907_04060 [Chitinimonas prasina]|uniref:Transposase IS4-like domain-containing protein n=1 Tax=Chitinimonas prasina TaxID=1434937 RepID=A0ABQ5Y9K7_9NEIS|nr:IS4 family transposase [Chitinimonas prasina]GLR11616.1 hypothetical protein GCM10007907_04060 [Chitinimonas prasina]
MRSDQFAAQARLHPAAFTRARKLPLPQLVTFMLNMPRAGLQAELDAFYDHALNHASTDSISKSAVCQARQALSDQAMRTLLQHSAALMAHHLPAPGWQGRRVLALDSTTLRVPPVPECAQAFGGLSTAGNRFRPLAQPSALFDVARGCVVDAVLGGYADDDRSLAAHHLPCLAPPDLVVMDRSYPSRKWLGALAERGIGFCVRISAKCWNAVAQFACGPVDDVLVEIGDATQTLPVRLICALLPNGAILLLATNVFDPAIRPAAFSDLYHSRWRIEEGFKLIKARLQVENWTGIMPHTVRQDFFTALTHLNCAAILTLEVEPAVDGLASHRVDGKGWRVRLNATLVLKSLRH